MELHDESVEPQAKDDVEVDATSQPHIRQVADRALPARQVLTQQIQGRGPDDQAPMFVPYLGSWERAGVPALPQ